MSVPGEAIEREADRLAESALSTSAAPPAPPRRSAPPASHLMPGGHALPRGIRSTFELGFGADLANVRLHTDVDAAKSAAALGASAYSVGEHVVFGAGRYAPHTSAGGRLLAHELAHTLQPGAERRIARQCESALAGVAVPEGDSRLLARARVDLGQVPITSGISASIAGGFQVLIHVPRALQQAISSGVGGAEPTRLPLDVLGDLRLRTEVSQETGRFTLRLTSSNTVSAAGGLLSLELRGRGTLSAPLPASLRLADLGGDFFRDVFAQGEGRGGLEGRLSIAGLPASFDANFRLSEGQLTGDASVLSPVGVGAGRFRYSLTQGFRAEAGALGLTYLVIAPPDARPDSERFLGPFQEYGFGSSVVGLGATGVSIQPNLTQILALGVGPQFVSEPSGVSSSVPGTVRLPVADVPTGIYAGVSYTLITDFDTLLTRGRR